MCLWSYFWDSAKVTRSVIISNKQNTLIVCCYKHFMIKAYCGNKTICTVSQKAMYVPPFLCDQKLFCDILTNSDKYDIADIYHWHHSFSMPNVILQINTTSQFSRTGSWIFNLMYGTNDKSSIVDLFYDIHRTRIPNECFYTIFK